MVLRNPFRFDPNHPSFFNKGMFLGNLAGHGSILVASLIFAPVGLAAFGLYTIGSIPGFLGGSIQRERLLKAAEKPPVPEKPKFFNEGFYQNLEKVGFVGLLFIAAARLFPELDWNLYTTMATSLSISITAATAGAFPELRRMQKEYKKAAIQTREHELSASTPALSQERSVEQELTLEAARDRVVQWVNVVEAKLQATKDSITSPTK